MSYHEENGQVVLTMSNQDYEYLLQSLGAYLCYTYDRNGAISLLNRLNEGNPNYTPYQVEKS